MEAEQKGDEVNPSESEAKEPHMEVINMKSHSARQSPDEGLVLDDEEENPEVEMVHEKGCEGPKPRMAQLCGGS